MQEPENEGPSGLLVDLVRAVIHAPRLLAEGLRRLRQAPGAVVRARQRLGGSWATVSTCALALGLSIVGWSKIGLDPFVLDRHAFGDEPWRLLSAHLVHANVVHLLFNLSWIWGLGRAIEQRLGSALLLGVTLFLMLGGSMAERAFDRGAIGLSGVVYGMWSLLFVGQTRCESLRGILTAKINRLMVAWFFFCILATATGMLPISNWGHGAGAVLGAVIGLSLRADGRVRGSAIPIGVVLLALLAGGATLWWPTWNFGGAALECEYEGIAALQRSDWKAAEAALRIAVRVDPHAGRAWWNLGCALGKLEREKEAVEACYRSFECGGLDGERIASLHEQLRWVLDTCEVENDPRAAFSWAQRAVKFAPADKEFWGQLRDISETLGKHEEAQRASEALAKLGVK